MCMADKKIPTEIYSRVVGYFRPINATNPGKREEIEERALANPTKIIKAVVNAKQRHTERV